MPYNPTHAMVQMTMLLMRKLGDQEASSHQPEKSPQWGVKPCPGSLHEQGPHRGGACQMEDKCKASLLE